MNKVAQLDIVPTPFMCPLYLSWQDNTRFPTVEAFKKNVSLLLSPGDKLSSVTEDLISCNGWDPPGVLGVDGKPGNVLRHVVSAINGSPPSRSQQST